MKGDLAIETIIRLTIVVIVVIITVQLINTWYMKIKSTKLPSIISEQKTGVEVYRGSINKEQLMFLMKSCYDRYKTSAPSSKLSDCYVVQSSRDISEQVYGDLISDMKDLYNITVKISSLDSKTIIISYDVSDDTIVVN